MQPYVAPGTIAVAGRRRKNSAVPTEQPGGAACQEGKSRGSGGGPTLQTRLAVSVPAGCAQSFSIRADATSSAAVTMDAAVSSGGSTPIRVWQSPPLQQHGQGQVQQGQQWHSQQQALVDGGIEVAVPSPLRGLSSEIRRREQSFQQLLAELERISAKCAKLSAGAEGRPGAGSRAAAASAPPRQACALGSPGAPAAPGCGQHTTHSFDSATREGPAEKSAIPAAVLHCHF